MSLHVSLLTVPDNTELEHILRAPVSNRICMHSWPLSMVEEIQMLDGQKYILKTQLSCASVERAFYERVEHSLLLSLHAAGSLADCDYLILPHAGGITESWDSLSDDEIRMRVRNLSAEFSRIQNAPVFYDLSSPERFSAAMDEIHPILHEGGLTAQEYDTLLSWCRSVAPCCWNAPVGLLHGDLKGGNILHDAHGRQFVIDWQRPLLAPLPLEESIALLLGGRSASDSTEFGVLALLYLAHWYAWAYGKCLPAPFVREIAVSYVRKSLDIINEHRHG